jgi:hypothetical protein
MRIRRRCRIDFHGGRAFGRVRGQLERHPAAGIARHGPAVQAEVEVFLQVGRCQHRDAAGREHVLALVRDGRGARRRVVAGDQQHAAVFCGSGVVGVLEHVAAAVDAGPLAIPHGKDAVELRLREQMQLLRAPDRGGRDVLVDAWLEADVVLFEEGPGAVQRGVQASQRRSAIAGNVAGGMQAGGAVDGMLQHRQAGQGLHAGEEDAAVFEPVLVFECDVCEIHCCPLRAVLRVFARSSHERSMADRSARHPGISVQVGNCAWWCTTRSGSGTNCDARGSFGVRHAGDALAAWPAPAGLGGGTPSPAGSGHVGQSLTRANLPSLTVISTVPRWS